MASRARRIDTRRMFAFTAGSLFLTSRIYVETTEPRIIGLSSVAGRNAQIAVIAKRCGEGVKSTRSTRSRSVFRMRENCEKAVVGATGRKRQKHERHALLHRFAGATVCCRWASRRCPPWAVMRLSRSQWNDSYGAHSGPSRGECCRRALRPTTTFTAANAMAAQRVRREKAALSSGCEAHPANAPAGSNRSSHGGDEMAEAFGVARHI